MLDVICFCLLLLAIVVLGIWALNSLLKIISIRSPWESPQRVAGKRGEAYAKSIIRTVIKEDDFWIKNLSLEVEGQRTEFDNIIVNSGGIFIIEVKNYVGELIGSEDEYEWIKKKTTSEHAYIKHVKNPIKQVKRQIYILSQFLKKNDVSVWINGYAFLVHGNSPVNSEMVLSTTEDIDKAIHGTKVKGFTESKKRKVIKLLERLSERK